MDNIKQEDIEDICFNVSQNIILPKFKNLSDDDINYKNETNMYYKKISLKKNVSFNSGEGMLIEQAALSWRRWFGDKPDTSGVKVSIENGRL